MNGFKAIIFIICLPVLLIIMIYYMDIAYIKSEVPDIKYFHELNDWINKNIEYKSDNIFEKKGDILYEILGDNWQYPKETLQLRKGDCEDKAILFIYLCKKILNKNCKGIWLVSPYSGGHFVVMYEDIIFDPTFGEVQYAKYYCYNHVFVPNKIYTWKELLKEIPNRRNLIYRY